jgi:hypothetical protein
VSCSTIVSAKRATWSPDKSSSLALLAWWAAPEGHVVAVERTSMPAMCATLVMSVLTGAWRSVPAGRQPSLFALQHGLLETLAPLDS